MDREWGKDKLEEKRTRDKVRRTEMWGKGR